MLLNLSPLFCGERLDQLDQFSRNLFRDDPRAFAHDAYARECCREAIARGDEARLLPAERMFLYMPFEHSEDLADQHRSVALSQAGLSDPEYLDYARRHLAVIERFGRFPHRNPILGRDSTPEEETHLAEHGGF